MKKIVSVLLVVLMLFSVSFAQTPTITSFLEVYASRVQKYSDNHPGSELNPFIYPMPATLGSITGIPFSAGNVFSDPDNGLLTKVKIHLDTINGTEESSEYINRFNLAIMAYSAVEYSQSDEETLRLMYKNGLGGAPDAYTACLTTFLQIVADMTQERIAKLLKFETIPLFETNNAKWYLTSNQAYDSKFIPIPHSANVYLCGEMK